MAGVTPHEVSFGVIYCLSLHPETSGNRRFGQRCSLQILTMTNPAAVLIIFVKILMIFIVPANIIDVVHPMGAVDCAWQAARFMAGAAFDYGADVPLQHICRLVVIRAFSGVRPYGMSAAVARFASNVTMPLAEPEECVCIFGKSFVCRQQRGC